MGTQKGHNKRSQAAIMKRRVFEIVGLLLLGFVLLAMSMMQSNEIKTILRNQNELTEYSNQYRLGSKALTYAVQSYAVSGDSKYEDDYYKELNTDKNRDIALEGMTEIGLSDKEWEYLEQISNLSNGLVPLEEEAFSSVDAGNMEQAVNAVFGKEYEETIVKINELTGRLINDIGERMTQRVDAEARNMAVGQGLLILIFVIIIIRVVSFIKFVRKELLHPIFQVQEEMQHLAEGDLSHEFLLPIDDSEVGQMSSSINIMKKNLKTLIDEVSNILNRMADGDFTCRIVNEYVGEFTSIQVSLNRILKDLNLALATVSDVADEVNHGSGILSESSQSLAKSSSDQANSVEEITAAMNSMQNTLRSNAEEARIAEDTSNGAAESLMKADKRLQELVSAIAVISEHSSQIGTIIGTINDIAFQTNLLALNAAIEAARAGEAGKGFAVVADQVKNLAVASAEAAGDTTELIQKTIDSVRTGTELANQTTKDVQDVVDRSRVTTDKMAGMVKALEEGANSFEEINLGLNQVANVVETNSATSEEIAATTQEQSDQILKLNQMLKHFVLNQ